MPTHTHTTLKKDILKTRNIEKYSLALSILNFSIIGNFVKKNDCLSGQKLQDSLIKFPSVKGSGADI